MIANASLTISAFRMINIWPIVLLLAGCGQQGQDTNNHGLGFEATAQGEYGIRLREPDSKVEVLAIAEVTYGKVQNHLGVTAPGPLIIFIESVDDRSTGGYQPFGLAYLDTGTIVIELHVLQSEGFLRAALAHEFCHWVTHYNDILTIDQQIRHEPEMLFINCTIAGAH